MTVVDELGRSTVLSADQLATAGLARSVDLTDLTPDLLPPTVQAVTITPATLDLSAPGARAVVRVQVAGFPTSGWAPVARVGLRHPLGSRVGVTFFAADAVPGAPGAYEASLPLGPLTRNGTFDVVEVAAFDQLVAFQRPGTWGGFVASFSPASRISGDGFDGVFAATVTLHSGTANGTYNATTLELSDAVGNARHYDEAGLAGAGVAATIIVTGAA